MKHRVVPTHGVLLYDGDCSFCTRLARFATRLGVGINVAPLQSFDLDAAGIDALRASREVPFLHLSGEVEYGHRAIASALRGAHGPWGTLGRLLTLGPMNVLSASGYRIVARYRHRLPGGSSHCQLTRPPT